MNIEYELSLDDQSVADWLFPVAFEFWTIDDVFNDL